MTLHLSSRLYHFGFILMLLHGQASLAMGRSITATLSSDLSEMSVTVAPGMGKLEAQAGSLMSELEIVSNAKRQGRFLVPLAADKPLVYRVKLTHSGTQWGISRWHSPLRLTDWTDWLLSPVNWAMTRPFDLELQVPDGMLAAVPFQLLGQQGGGFLYRAYPILPDHGGMALFGSADRRILSVGDQEISAVVVGEPGDTSEMYFDWIEQVAGVAVDVHGGAPGEKSMVIVIPVPFVSGVVPWAHVKRGGGSHIIAYVREDAGIDELLADWTLFHEMTHLYHPYLHSGGRWISEGFASYYQNVYRARAGVVDPEYAYSRLLAGLERGRSENEDAGNRPVTAGGRMRTYWTAAAMAFEADAQVRKNSDGEQDLAMAIGRFAGSQMPVDRSWHPRDYLAALDQELEKPVMVTMYDDYVRDRFFPEPELATHWWTEIFSSPVTSSIPHKPL